MTLNCSFLAYIFCYQLQLSIIYLRTSFINVFLSKLRKRLLFIPFIKLISSILRKSHLLFLELVIVLKYLLMHTTWILLQILLIKTHHPYWHLLIINVSIEKSHIPKVLKQEHIQPLLKNMVPGDNILINYRLVADLLFV